MVIRVAVSAARKAIESLYTDRGVITEYQSYKKENGAIGQREVITVQNQPCRISFSSISTTDATRTVSEYAQTVKLFLSPDIVVKAGSKITVERNGIVTAYRNSGESAKYDTHQEIPLELSARLAECFITINKNRYNFMQAINLEAKFEKTKSEVPILGRTGAGNKATGWKGTGSATFHYNTSIFREMLVKYKESGEDAYFEIQVSNEDPTSAAGRQTIVFIDCNTDGGILAKFDADGEYLDEDMDFTFEDFKMPELFNLLDGMK